MDFGIARALHGASTTMTQTGMVMGTPQYLSPEQALGKAVDHRSDLYATGCLLYELLALRPPFTGETPLSVVYQHVQDIPVPPSRRSRTASARRSSTAWSCARWRRTPTTVSRRAEEMRGLVQYALQMLYDQGGHTGTWNTGPVGVARRPRHAVRRASRAPPRCRTPADGSGTTQIPQPILPAGYGGGDDGGFEGHGNQGSGRGKLWILARLRGDRHRGGRRARAERQRWTAPAAAGPAPSPTTSPSRRRTATDPSDGAERRGDRHVHGRQHGRRHGRSNYDHDYSPSYKPSRSAPPRRPSPTTTSRRTTRGRPPSRRTSRRTRRTRPTPRGVAGIRRAARTPGHADDPRRARGPGNGRVGRRAWPVAGAGVAGHPANASRTASYSRVHHTTSADGRRELRVRAGVAALVVPAQHPEVVEALPPHPVHGRRESRGRGARRTPVRARVGPHLRQVERRRGADEEDRGGTYGLLRAGLHAEPVPVDDRGGRVARGRAG